MDEVELLQRLVRCPSVTPEDNGVISVFQEALEALGFEVEIINFEDERSYPVSNIYARLGNGPVALGFCGHLDVVPPGDVNNWTSPPFAAEIVNNEIVGRGTEDMKGNIACFIAAISNIVQSFDHERNSLIMLITLDEEHLAINGISKLIEHVITHKNIEIEGVLVGEPTCKQYVGDCIKFGRRGSLNFIITTVGKQGHVAYSSLSRNPIPVANAIINDLLNITFDQEPPQGFEQARLQLTGISSSSNVYNIVPNSVRFQGNIRYHPGYTAEGLQRLIADIVARYQDTNLEFLADIARPYVSSTNSKIFTCMRDTVIEATGREPMVDTFGGTSDGRFIGQYTNVIEFGLVERTAHQTDERVVIDDLRTLTRIYTLFLRNYFRQ